MIDWHRLFGLVLSDLFAGSPWIVELEKDLSAKRQLLDVVVVRRGEGTFSERLPDGLGPLADHNLITYRSLHDTLDDWTLKELTGHYVNYRKFVSGQDELSPETGFRLLGVSTRYPQKLAGQVRMEPSATSGVYQVMRGTDQITIIVLNEVSREEHNSFWHLFSAVPANIQYGAAHYRQRTDDASTILNHVFKNYQQEGVVMPYTIEDFRRDVAKEYLSTLSPEERLAGLSSEEIEALLERLKRPGRERESYTIEDFRRDFTKEHLDLLSPEEVIEGLSAQQREALRRKLNPTQARARRTRQGPKRPPPRRKGKEK